LADFVVKSGGRSPQSPGQSSNLKDALLDRARRATDADLTVDQLVAGLVAYVADERRPYLTVAQLVKYLGFPSERAARAWVKEVGIPPCRRGKRTLLVLRRDVDHAVQPGKQVGQRHA
jgi:hypothetical protein